jgi:hypothetical protein
MLRKFFSPIVLISLLFPFLVSRVAFAQNIFPKTPTENQQLPPGFRSGKMRQNASQAGAAPQGRWVPGHHEIKDGKNTWIPGHYEPATKDTYTASPTATPKTTSSQQDGAGPASAKEGFVRPFKQEPAGSTRRWIPGHQTVINGIETMIRGHYSDEQGAITGPMSDQLQATDQVTTEQDISPKVKPQGWAVVIGISKYKNAAESFPELRYATKDAEMFYNFLRSPEGGGFPAERIVFLRDDEATLQRIRYAFFDFLKQPLEEDFVIIYFAGHGTPEKDNLKNLYLVAYDSKPDQLASTAFPMWDINTALTRYIKSEKVIVLADACHSSGIVGDVSTRSVRKQNMVSKCFLELATAKKGLAIFTASEAGELSQESKNWGGGHGVFTHFLINGLNGKADENNDKVVTLGEVTAFVSENVRRATKSAQHPISAGFFDWGFPMAILEH